MGYQLQSQVQVQMTNDMWQDVKELIKYFKSTAKVMQIIRKLPEK